MKRFILSFILPLATLAIMSSCQKELDSPGNETIAPGVKLVINAGTPEVKSYMEYDSDNQKYLPRWHKNDALGVFIDSWEAGAAAVNGKLENSSVNGERAQFTGTISAADGSHKAYAFYPARAYYASEASRIVDLEIPYIQFPTATSFDPKADILVSVPKDFEVTEGTVSQMDMQFSRIGAILKVTLNDQTLDLSGDKIKSVKLETSDAVLTGAIRYDFENEVIPSDAPMVSTYKYVTADFSESPMEMEGNAVFFVVNPVTLAAGSTLTVTVLTDNHEIVKTISSLPEIQLERGKLRPLKITLRDTDSIERVYFKDTFDWLYKYWDDLSDSNTPSFATAYLRSQTGQAETDPVSTSTSTHAQPNIWSKFSKTVGKAFKESMGYVDMNKDGEVLYVEENYLKIGATAKQTAIQLPLIDFGNGPVNVTLSFKWCRHMSNAGNIDTVPLVIEVLNQGTCSDTDASKSNVFTTTQSKGSLRWTEASIVLKNVTNDTRIVFKENYDTYTVSGVHRFHLDDIKITKAPAEFPVIWTFLEPGDNWKRGEDYDLQNPSGSYVYSEFPRHAGKLSIIRPGDDRITSSNPSYKKDDTPPWDGNVRLLQFGVYEKDEIRFEVDRVDNPAGKYTIEYTASSSNAGPRDFALEYSTNRGGTWTHFADYSLRCADGGVTNQKTEVKGSFNLTAFKGKLFIRARVSSTKKLDGTGEMSSKTHGGTTRIGVNASIKFEAVE